MSSVSPEYQEQLDRLSERCRADGELRQAISDFDRVFVPTHVDAQELALGGLDMALAEQYKIVAEANRRIDQIQGDRRILLIQMGRVSRKGFDVA